MDAAWPRRMRWRRRGAWLWPTFMAATVADAVIGVTLPLAGESEGAFAAGLAGLVLNVIGVIVLAPVVAMGLRRLRPDLPMVVARDYGGTAVVTAVSALMLAGGLAHHASVVHDRQAQQDAVSRAQAYIGDRAPAEFRRNLEWVNTFAIEPGRIYRACVPNGSGTRTYCVIVDTRVPFPRGVRFGGYEPNSTFSTGVS